MAAEPELTIRRAFNWGIVMISDSQQGEPPAPEGSVVTASPTGITICVHHAQDVDTEGLDDDEPIPGFLVVIECRLGSAPSGTATIHAGEIQVPSGRLLIGDADSEDVLSLVPGPWHYEIAARPPDYPDELTIWLSGQQP